MEKIVLLLFLAFMGNNLNASNQHNNAYWLDSLESLLFFDNNVETNAYELDPIFNEIKENWLTIDSNLTVWKIQPNTKLVISVLDSLLLVKNPDKDRFNNIYDKYMSTYFDNWSEWYIQNRNDIVRWFGNPILGRYLEIALKFDCVAHAYYLDNKKHIPNELYSYIKEMIFNVSYESQPVIQSRTASPYSYYINDQLRSLCQIIKVTLVGIDYVRRFEDILRPYFIQEMIDVEWGNLYDTTRIKGTPEGYLVYTFVNLGVYYRIKDKTLYSDYLNDMNHWFETGYGPMLCRIIGRIDSNEVLLRSAVELISNMDSLKSLNQNLDEEARNWCFIWLLNSYDKSNTQIAIDELKSLLPKRLNNQNFDILGLLYFFLDDETIDIFITLPRKYELPKNTLKLRERYLRKVAYCYENQDRRPNYFNVSVNKYKTVIKILKR